METRWKIGSNKKQMRNNESVTLEVQRSIPSRKNVLQALSEIWALDMGQRSSQSGNAFSAETVVEKRHLPQLRLCASRQGCSQSFDAFETDFIVIQADTLKSAALRQHSGNGNCAFVSGFRCGRD